MSDYNEEVLEAIYEELLESGYLDCPETSEYSYTLFNYLIAQLEERFHGMEEVEGSIPSSST